MFRKFIAFLLTIIIIIFVFVRCLPSSNGIRDDELIGTWLWEMSPAYQLTFNEDGTGNWSGVLDSFEWQTGSLENQNLLRFTSTENNVEYVWVYRFDSRSNLIIASVDEFGNVGINFTYRRIGTD